MFRSAMLGWMLLVLLGCLPAFGQVQTHRAEHVVVQYQGIDEAHAKAMGAVIAAAREAAIHRFGFDMPETVTLRVTVGPDQQVRLFTDGKDTFSLSARSAGDLRKPAVTGVFHLYGLCHELGHLGMYRPIQERAWLTSAAAEGWAHYVGSALVDDAHAKLGDQGWPDAYDYRADGTARLTRQLADPKADDTTKAAGLWRELIEIIGEKKAGALMAAWGKAKLDLANPAPGLRAEAQALSPDGRLAAWWAKAEPLLIARQQKSAFKPRTYADKDLAGKPQELAHDDGQKARAASTAGGGHAVEFAAPGPESVLTAVKIHGARYGPVQPPAQSFHVWLLDEAGKVIADFPFPYSSFARGNADWVTLKVRPSAVPAKFTLCVGFNPTASNGVFMSYDAGNSGHSRSGLPNKLGGAGARRLADPGGGG